jgi:hypothetical protein
MDPLSVTASAIAIGQAASAVAIGVRALRTLANGPDEFADLLRDLSAFEIVLEVTRASVNALQTLGSHVPGKALVALQALHHQLCLCTTEIDGFVNRMTAESKGINKKGQHRIPRIRWLCEKATVSKLRQRVQHLQLELSACFTAVSATHGYGIQSYGVGAGLTSN